MFGACRNAEAFAVPPSTSLGPEPFNLLRLSGLIRQNSPSTDRSWRILLKKSLSAPGRNCVASLVSLAHSDLRDRIASRKIDHGSSRVSRSSVQRRMRPDAGFGGIFEVDRFSTFSTVSAQSGLSISDADRWPDAVKAGYRASWGLRTQRDWPFMQESSGTMFDGQDSRPVSATEINDLLMKDVEIRRMMAC